MADLASLMNVAPITGGMMIGQQNQSEMATAEVERQRLAQLVQELQLKNQQSQGMNPLLQQQQQLQNQGLQAGLPGIQAKSLMDQLTAQQKQGTIGTDTAAINSGNISKIRQNKSSDLASLQQDLLKYGSTLNNVPVPMRASVLHSLMVAGGHNMDDPASAQLLQSITADPENMPQNLQKAAEHLGNIAKVQDPNYLGHIEGSRITADSHIKGAQIGAGATIGAAKIGAASREDVQAAKNELLLQKLQQSQNIQARIVELSKQPQTPETVATIQELTRIGQSLSPQTGTAIDLPALQQGVLQRQGDRAPSTGKLTSGATYRVIKTP